MAPSESANRISLSDAGKLGVSGLVREAEEGREQIILRDDKPVAAVMGMERFEQLQQLQDDLIDITMVAARVMMDDGQRYSLDEVLKQFGYTREELADEPELHGAEPQSRR